MRFYNTAYSRKFSMGKVLKNANRIISMNAYDGNFFTHIAMNYSLKDDFIGLNMDPKLKDRNNLMVEKTETMYNKDIFNNELSIFSVRCYPLTKQEYEIFKSNVENYKKSNKLKYDLFNLLRIGWEEQLIKLKKIKQLRHSRESDENSNDFSNEVQRLVCSSFVSFVLAKVSNKFRIYLEKNDKNAKYFSPNSLASIPDLVTLFSGSTNEYTKKLNEFLKSNPKFAKFK